MKSCDMGREGFKNAVFATDVLEETIFDISIRNFKKLVHEMVLLTLAFLKNFFSHFSYQSKLGKVET